MRRMYTEHPEFSPPSHPDADIWRYMDLTKFLSLLEDKALFFSSASSISDNFEGTRSSLTVASKAALGRGMAAFDACITSPLNELYRKYMYLSCWHSSQHESAAMWSLFQRDGSGIAVRSTFRRLTESFNSERLIYAGLVNYADFDRIVIPDNNIYAPYLYKRLSFEHEQEIRAVTADLGTALEAWEVANRSFNPTISTAPGQDIDAELNKLEDAYRTLDPSFPLSVAYLFRSIWSGSSKPSISLPRRPTGSASSSRNFSAGMVASGQSSTRTSAGTLSIEPSAPCSGMRPHRRLLISVSSVG
jgi:hypothetical protein